MTLSILINLSDSEHTDSSDAWQKLVPIKYKRPSDTEIRESYGDALIQDYCKLFQQECWNSPNFDRMSFHVLFGQLSSSKRMRIKVAKTFIDLRIFGVLFQDAGSGKGRGFSFVADFAKELGLSYQPLTEITDAALLGSVEIEEEYVPKKGKVVTKKIVEGWLHQNSNINVVAMEEAGLLFDMKASNHTKNVMTYYQIAMNAMDTEANKLVKKLVSGPTITCTPVCSFLFTTYYPENLLETIVRRGFLQRMLIVINEITTKDRENNALTSVANLEVDSSVETEMKDVVQRLQQVNRHYATTIRLDVDANARAGFKTVVRDLFDTIRDITRLPRKKLEEFIHRYLEITYRLSYHHAMLRLSDTVEVVDVAYAKNFMMPLWGKIVGLIEDSLVESAQDLSKRQLTISTVVKCYQGLVDQRFNNGLVPQTYLQSVVRAQMKVSDQVAIKRINLTIEEGLFEREIRGLTTFVKIVKSNP